MNKIDRKEKLSGKKDYIFEKESHTTYVLLSDQTFDITLTLLENAKVEVFHYGKNTSGTIRIYLEGEHAEIKYYYNTVNEEDHKIKMEVYHKAKETTSILSMHGFNQEEKALSFLVDVTIPKGMIKSKAIQENRIYNRKDGTALITPNLYIDEFDVDAAHSSYTGPFLDEVKFYLQTRGLAEKQIETLLLEALLIKEGLEEREKFDFFGIRKEG